MAIADVVEDIGRRGAILAGGLIELECEAKGLRVPSCLGLQVDVSLWFRRRRGLDVADDKRGQEDKRRGVFDQSLSEMSNNFLASDIGGAMGALVRAKAMLIPVREYVADFFISGVLGNGLFDK